MRAALGDDAICGRSADGQRTRREGEIENAGSEQGIDDGPGHGGVKSGMGLFDELRPVARFRVVFDADPNVGRHQLEAEQGERGGETDTGEDFHHSIVGAFFLVVFDLKGGGLGGSGCRGAQRLGGGLKLDRRFREGGGATWQAGRAWGFEGSGSDRRSRCGKADRRRG